MAMPETRRIKFRWVSTLNEYQKGYLQALRDYAHWKDGTQYVGSCGMTLHDAERRFLSDQQVIAEPVAVAVKEARDA